MDDMLTLALVVLICAIVVMFSREFGSFFKKIFAIRGMTIFLPLILATFLIVYFEPWVFSGLVKIQSMLLIITATLTRGLPFQIGAAYVVNTLVLLGLSFLPVLAINYWVKRKTYHSFQYSYLTCTILWLLVAVLLTLAQHY